MMRYNRDFRVVYLSPSAERFTGIPASQFMGKTNREVGMPEHLCDLWEKAIEEVFRTGTQRELEFDFESPEGKRTFVLRLAPELGSNSAFEHVLGISTDITDRKQAEKSVRQALSRAEEERQILDAMMEYIPMGITIAEAPDVKIRAVSRLGRELTGKPRKMIEGIAVERHAKAFDIFHSDGVTPANNEELPLTRATQKGELVREEEWVLRRPDGTKIPILCTAAPIRDSKGNVIGGVIGWQDITERKQMEQSLLEREERVQSQLVEIETIYHSAPVGMCVFDRDLRYVRVNSGIGTLLIY